MYVSYTFCFDRTLYVRESEFLDSAHALCGDLQRPKQGTHLLKSGFKTYVLQRRHDRDSPSFFMPKTGVNDICFINFPAMSLLLDRKDLNY